MSILRSKFPDIQIPDNLNFADFVLNGAKDQKEKIALVCIFHS